MIATTTFMKKAIRKYFGSKYRLIVYFIGLAIFAFLYAVEAHRGSNLNGAAGFALGFGFAWILLVEVDREQNVRESGE